MPAVCSTNRISSWYQPRLAALSENLTKFTLVGALLPWNLTVAGGEPNDPLDELLSGSRSIIPSQPCVVQRSVLFVLMLCGASTRMSLEA